MRNIPGLLLENVLHWLNGGWGGNNLLFPLFRILHARSNIPQRIIGKYNLFALVFPLSSFPSSIHSLQTHFRFTYFAIGIFPPINKQFSIYSIIRCIFSYTYSFCRGLYILCVYTFYAFHVASTHNQYLSVYRFPQESATNWKTVKLNWNVLIRVRLPALSSVLEVF